MQTDALLQMINERLARRDKVRAQLDALEVEIRVLQEAAERMGGALAQAPTRRSRAAAHAGDRERALKSEWAEVLRFIGSSETASLDAIMAWAKANGHNINRNTLRSQASIYTDRGWLRRVTDGQYALTDDGAAKCGFVPEARNDEADVTGHHVGLASRGEDPIGAKIRLAV